MARTFLLINFNVLIAPFRRCIIAVVIGMKSHKIICQLLMNYLLPGRITEIDYQANMDFLSVCN